MALVGAFDDHFINAHVRSVGGDHNTFPRCRRPSTARRLHRPFYLASSPWNRTTENQFTAWIDCAHPHAGATQLPQLFVDGSSAALAPQSPSQLSGDPPAMADIQESHPDYAPAERPATAQTPGRLQHEFPIRILAPATVSIPSAAGAADEHVHLSVNFPPSHKRSPRTFWATSSTAHSLRGTRFFLSALRILQAFEPARSQQQTRASPRKGQRRRCSEAARCARNQDPFVGERRCHNAMKIPRA